MKVVVAIDSFKGSLSSVEAGNAAKEGIRKARQADVIVKPLADGGIYRERLQWDARCGSRRRIGLCVLKLSSKRGAEIGN